jgi:hypothetical protein
MANPINSGNYYVPNQEAPSPNSRADVYNIDQMPSIEQTQFGSGTTFFPEEGNIYRLFSAGTAPASTGSDIVVAVFQLSANSFDVAGRSLTICASGNFANNTNTKTVKIIFNPTTATIGSAISSGTTIATTGAYSTTGAVGWSLVANVSKYGAIGSNTQMYQEMGVIIGSTHGGMGAAATLTATESSPILIAVTINSATTASDATLWQFEINATN